MMNSMLVVDLVGYLDLFDLFQSTTVYSAGLFKNLCFFRFFCFVFLRRLGPLQDSRGLNVRVFALVLVTQTRKVGRKKDRNET